MAKRKGLEVSDHGDDFENNDGQADGEGSTERRSGKDRRQNSDRRGPLRWDPRQRERRTGHGRRKSDQNGNLDDDV